ncbi:unnamed protein product, partial [Pylaiella littoralis]
LAASTSWPILWEVVVRSWRNKTHVLTTSAFSFLSFILQEGAGDAIFVLRTRRSRSLYTIFFPALLADSCLSMPGISSDPAAPLAYPLRHASKTPHNDKFPRVNK